MLCTAYKIYVEILRGRVNHKGELLPESQGGFREGRGTIDNIFVLNHLCQRKKRRKERKIYAAFVNLSAAFDNVNREKL